MAFASILFYYAEADPEKTAALDKETALFSVACMSSVWLVSFSLFMATMNGKYRSTFFSLKTCYRVTEERFCNEGNSDEMRIEIVRKNRRHWEPIRPQVKEFIAENWDKWNEEQPDWFTEVFKSSIDDDLLPLSELRRQTIAGGGKRRRSSFIEQLVPGEVAANIARVAPQPPE